nr:MAG TPA: hypothetical protein [Caudoviricetes sp.]
MRQKFSLIFSLTRFKIVLLYFHKSLEIIENKGFYQLHFISVYVPFIIRIPPAAP